ncbi:MAG: hypothetical protein A2636_05970 [Elusimicrobia bacterium RIFCSPHIGHO2_01_FULL_64_10]|nr:MAG: hypothetical protein A2636_05970 [Elusimicrobia bacterium RIFCSPHIGHO2_01_FULL_64_10]
MKPPKSTEASVLTQIAPEDRTRGSSLRASPGPRSSISEGSIPFWTAHLAYFSTMEKFSGAVATSRVPVSFQGSPRLWA